LYSYYMNKVKSEDSKMAYYALGLIWERGLGREKNLVEAVRWYKYAAQMIYWAAADRLIYLYNQGKFSEKNVRIKEFWQKATTGKKFTVPSLLPDGEKIPVDIYITNFPLNEDNPLEAEVFRAKDIHNAQVPDEVVTSFKKLYDIAKENNVGFEDLCVYALGEANKVNKNQNQVIEAHIDYEREAQRFDPISHADSVLINTEKAIINKYNIYIKKDFVGAYNWVVKEIVSNNQNDNFLLYYVLGYLYETSPTNKNINKAIQWYMYAFQMGYKPAYVKLRRLFKFISESKVEWLDKNYLKKPAETNITAYDGNGKSIQKKIYLLDFPVNYLNPLQHEEDRLKDVFGLTLNKETVESFRSIYNTAKNNNVSFQDHYFKKVVEFERNKVKSEDQKYLESGISLYLKKNYIEAYEQFSLAIRFNPKNSKAYFYRGAISFAQNEYQKSAVDFEKALAIEPDDKDYNLILGGCYIELKNYKKAKEYYERAYELGNNKNNILCYNLACIYSVDKRSVKALRFFEEALENGYRNFDHIKKDTDLDYIRDISRFRELVEKYSKK
ncbi:MAG TPA: DUF2610 domain-containing protein, partial [Emticicia sp.]